MEALIYFQDVNSTLILQLDFETNLFQMFTDVRVQKLKFKTNTFSGNSKVYTVYLKNS